MQILWAALLSSVFVYVGVLFFLRGQTPAAELRAPMLPWAFAAAAFASLGASVVLPRTLHRQAARTAAQNLATQEVFAEQLPGGAGLRGAPSSTRVFADPAAAEAAAFQTALTPMILACALRESVALFGLVLGFMGAPPAAWAPFIAVGALAIAAEMPSRPRVRGAFERATGVGFPAG